MAPPGFEPVTFGIIIQHANHYWFGIIKIQGRCFYCHLLLWGPLAASPRRHKLCMTKIYILADTFPLEASFEHLMIPLIIIIKAEINVKVFSKTKTKLELPKYFELWIYLQNRQLLYSYKYGNSAACQKVKSKQKTCFSWAQADL